MQKTSVLTPEGLKELKNSKRFRVQQELVKSSQVVYHYGKPIGNIWTPEQFHQILNKFPMNESRKEAAFKMFSEFSRAWGSSGHRVFPIEMFDGLIDFISKD